MMSPLKPDQRQLLSRPARHGLPRSVDAGKPVQDLVDQGVFTRDPDPDAGVDVASSRTWHHSKRRSSYGDA